jgi:hypothetical protein
LVCLMTEINVKFDLVCSMLVYLIVLLRQSTWSGSRTICKGLTIGWMTVLSLRLGRKNDSYDDV